MVSLLRRAGYGAIAPESLSEELKAMVNKKKVALLAAGESRRRIPSTAAIESWLDQVMEEDGLWGWVFAMVATYGLRPLATSKKKTPEPCPGVPRVVPRASPARLTSRTVETVFGRRQSHRPEHQGRSGVQCQHLSVLR